MDRSNIAELISVTYSVDALAQRIPVEENRTVFCNIASVSQQEFFEAGRNGLKPEYRLTMFAGDYNNEMIAVINGQRYSVYRTYYGRNDSVELYLERKAGTDGTTV